MNEWAIDVDKLNKSFGDKHVVRDVSLQVAPGEIFGFLGPNGSGKTTTIRMVCGLLTPDSGQGHCLGYDILTESYQIKSHVGYMTQRFSMWEDLTIRENLEFIACMYDLDQKNERIARSLERLHLQYSSSQLVSSLSGGWKQRLALEACMLHDPKLLLLDEPTAGVDPKARRDFWDELYALAARGISVLVSTHYMDEAERCHKLAYISNGQLVAQGTPLELIAHQNIVTFAVIANDLILLSKKLKDVPGIHQTIVFGQELHVSGKDRELMEKGLKELQRKISFRYESIPTNLEDVFIHLMEKA